jgi:uncharacterized protein (DUF488 family)
MPIITVGHSNKKLPDLVALLQGAGVTDLVDVRSRPYSRFNPWFNKASLAAELPLNNIIYYWWGNHLGGLDGNTEYEKYIREVVNISRGVTVAIMCSEGPVNNCHRRYMLTPDLQAAGGDVWDLDWRGNVAQAPPMARREVDDTPTTEPLF